MQLASTQSLPIHGGTAAVDICSPPKEEDINQAHLEQVSRWMAFSPLTVCPRIVVFSLAQQISSSPVWPKLFPYVHPWQTDCLNMTGTILSCVCWTTQVGENLCKSEISDIAQSFRVFQKDNEAQGTVIRNINSESAYNAFFSSPSANDHMWEKRLHLFIAVFHQEA